MGKFYKPSERNKTTPTPTEIYDYTEKLKSAMKPSQANIVLSIYAEPSLLDKCSLTEDDFTDERWKTYFKIAKGLHEKGRSLTENNIKFYLGSDDSCEIRPELRKQYDYYQGWKTIEKGVKMVLVSDFESYVNELKSFMAMYRYTNSFKLIDPKIICDFEINKIYGDLQTKLDLSFSSSSSKKIEHPIGYGLDGLIELLNKGNQKGLEIGMDMPRLNKTINGFLPGRIYGLGALSGVGKSTIAINMLAKIAIKKEGKVVMIINEEDYTKVQQEMLLLFINAENYPFKKNRFFEGDFSDDEIKILKGAAELLEQLNDWFQIVALESYTRSAVEQTIRKYARQGYKYFCVDTFKESLDSSDSEIWRSMQRDANALADLIKPSNFNVCLLMTYQLSKGAAKETHLTCDNIGQSKSIVDVMSVNMMMRRVGRNESNLNYKENEQDTEAEIIDKDKDYVLIFIDKNRNGPVLHEPILYEIDYSRQKIKEKGYAMI